MTMEHILTWLGRESAYLVNDEPNKDLEEGRNQVSFIRVSSVEKLSDNTIEIKWRGWGQRRGVCFIGDGDGIYLGYSPAGNGTGAVMFPIPPTSSYYKDLVVEVGNYAIRQAMASVPSIFDHLESESIEF